MASAEIEEVNNETDHFCRLLLYEEINHSGVHYWDLIIIIPNVCFLLYLAIRFNRALLKLRATSSPIFLAFYGLVVLNTVISIVRCIVSMTVNAAVTAGDYIDKILWLTVRFFLFSTEMSVLTFGLAFGHLDSRTSIKRVLLVTSFISLLYSCTQGFLEFGSSTSLAVINAGHGIFTHGGILFWCVSSAIFGLLYGIILLLPFTKLQERLPLPTKRSFYYYIMLLVFVNIIQALGCGILLYNYVEGLCLVDITSYLYFTFFTALVYITFLKDFFGVPQQSVLFSYKTQVDEQLEDDSVSLPHQHSLSSLKTDSDYIYQSGGAYDSTPFDLSLPHENQMYHHSLQSPDSVTAHSINSVESSPRDYHHHIWK